MPNNNKNYYRLNKVIEEYIKNIHPDTKTLIMKKFWETASENGAVKLDRIIRDYLGIETPLNKYCDEYWFKRGWIDGKPHSVKRVNNSSPFSMQYWIDKGFTETEAEYKRNSIRPIRKEYWLEKGYTDEDAIIKAKETKNTNNKKGSSNNSQRSITQHRLSSKRCIEYWLSYHMGDEEKALISLRKQQSTFSLEKCVSKHGLFDGYNIWKQRQVKWLNTFYNNNDMEQINKQKSRWYYGIINRGHSHDYAKEYLISNGLVKDEYSFIRQLIDIKSRIKTLPYLSIYKSMFSKSQWCVVGVFNADQCYDFLNTHIGYISTYGKIYQCHHGYYQMQTKKGLLRSSYEIAFYEMLMEAGIDDFEIETVYPNSTMRCDFFVRGVYIEIAPLYNTDKLYRIKMDKKSKLFGCMILDGDVDTYKDIIDLIGKFPKE